MTRTLREMILGALDDAGGEDYLAEQAHKNPAAFMALLGRVLPREMQTDEVPLVITLNFGTELRRPRPAIEGAEHSLGHSAPKLLSALKE